MLRIKIVISDVGVCARIVAIWSKHLSTSKADLTRGLGCRKEAQAHIGFAGVVLTFRAGRDKSLALVVRE